MIIYPEDIKIKEVAQSLRNSHDLKSLSLIDYPNHFVSDKKKKEPTYIKTTLDYYKKIAIQNYEYKYKEYKANYDLLNGEINAQYLYQEMAETIDKESGGLISLLNSSEVLEGNYDQRGLPNWVRHYSALIQPINTLIGEVSKRADPSIPRAMDDQSLSERADFYTEKVEELYIEMLRSKVENQQQPPENDEQKKAYEDKMKKIEDRFKKSIEGFSSKAEVWSSFFVESCAVEFELKDKRETAMKDLLAVSNEFFEIREDNTKTGMTVDLLNPMKVWTILPKGGKYSRDSIASGFVEEMTINEILKRFNLSEEEIKHLTDELDGTLTRYRTSPTLAKGEAIYIPENEDHLRFPMSTEVINAYSKDYLFGDRTTYTDYNKAIDRRKRTFTVTVSYFEAFKKIGLLTYKEINGDTGEEEERAVIVDDTYQKGMHPREVNLQWTYEPQFYMGYTIGEYIYGLQELEILDYCPIIGVIHNNRNTKAKSFLDMLKPFSALYDLLVNQIWDIAGKEYGVVFSGDLNHIPNTEDSDDGDSVEDLKLQMKEEGMVFSDTSIKNTKVAGHNTQIFRSIDLTRSNEMITRMNLAQAVKEEAHALVGINRQRLGGIVASDTVGGINVATSQSFAQTEPIILQHEYIINQVNQAIVDAGLYIESKKPESTLNFINSEGNSIFFKVTGEAIRGRDIKLFFTSRGRDVDAYNALRALAPHYVQSGGDLYDASLLYTTSSIRYMQDTFKKMKEKKEELEMSRAQMEQEMFKAEQQAKQQSVEIDVKKHQDIMNMEKYKIDKEAETKIMIERLSNFFRDAGGDYDNVEGPDAQVIYENALRKQKIESDNFSKERQAAQKERELTLKEQSEQSRTNMEQQKLDLKRREIESKEYIAKVNKNKYDKK